MPPAVGWCQESARPRRAEEASNCDQAGPAARSRRHPVRRRLRRRHAAHRRPVHPETAVFGNDLSTLPNFPAEIRAPAGTLAGVSSFQLHFADHDILTPGDAPDVLVAMNPAALKANLTDLPAGRRPHRQHRRVHQAQPDQGRLRRAARWRTTRSSGTTAPGAADLDDRRGAGGPRRHQEGRRAGEEHVRPRPALVAVRPARRRRPCPSSSAKFASKPEILARPTSPRSRPAGTTARPPRPSRSGTRSSRPR